MRSDAMYGAPPGSSHAARTAYARWRTLSSYTTGPWRVYLSVTVAGDSPFTGIDSRRVRIDSHAPLY